MRRAEGHTTAPDIAAVLQGVGGPSLRGKRVFHHYSLIALLFTAILVGAAIIKDTMSRTGFSLNVSPPSPSIHELHSPTDDVIQMLNRTVDAQNHARNRALNRGDIEQALKISQNF